MIIATNNTNHLRNGILLGLLALIPLTARVQAEGHGPTFGLATPTLGKGQWSSDTIGMALGTDEGTSFMTREWIGYGITEDLQATLGFPLSPTIDKLSSPPRTRVGSMMGAFGDVEGSWLWRFQRRAPAVGSRFESTLMLGGSLPTADKRGGVRVGPSLNVVSLNKGNAVIQFVPDSHVTLAEIQQRVRDSGFTPKNAKVKVSGTLKKEGEGFRLHVGDTNYALKPSENAKGAWQRLKQAGKGATVTVVGDMPADHDDDDQILVQKVTP